MGCAQPGPYVCIVIVTSLAYSAITTCPVVSLHEAWYVNAGCSLKTAQGDLTITTGSSFECSEKAQYGHQQVFDLFFITPF